MSHIPLSYAFKSVLARKLTTALTAGGMALVVFVFAAVLMLAQGLKDTLVQTGSADNVMVIRRGAETEVQSEVQRAQAAVIASLPQIAHGTGGQRLVSKETVVLMVLPKRGSLKPSNVVIRGLSAEGFALRPQVRLSQGRLFRPGAAEVIAGQKVAQGFLGAGIGERLRLGLRDWTVVGTFDAGDTGFSSEIWGDANQLMQAFRRQSFSSLIFKLGQPSALPAIRARIKDDPRLTVEAKRETQFYLEQSEVMVTFLDILGLTLSVMFSIGAVIGAMITMYAAVASRTSEIGTLRALGFRRRSILIAFLVESLVLALIGGVVGLGLASCMQFASISTMNWQSFSELAFRFSLTPSIALQSLVFALCMGLLGGFLPAVKAARMGITQAQRAA